MGGPQQPGAENLGGEVRTVERGLESTRQTSEDSGTYLAAP